MGKQLKSPPLVEALCEFKFKPSVDNSEWDMTIPGSLYKLIQEDFPHRSQQVNEVVIQLQPQPNSNPVSSVVQRVNRLQMKRADGSAMVQIEPNNLIINQLKYQTWNNFVNLIIRVFENYVTLLDDSTTLSKVGLRYINHIPTPQNQPFEIEDFLSIAPDLKGELHRPLSSFYQQYGFGYAEEKSVLNLRTLIAEKPEFGLIIVLDLDFSSEQVGDFLLDINKIKLWLEKAHDNIERTFISSLNKDYYDLIK